MRRVYLCFFFFSSRRRHTRYWRDWSSDVCSSDLVGDALDRAQRRGRGAQGRGQEGRQQRRRDLFPDVVEEAGRADPRDAAVQPARIDRTWLHLAILDSSRMPARAVLFDFNGTLSDDEPIVCAIFQELFAERGRPLSAETYFSELAGTSDPEIVRAWLGAEDRALVAEKAARYRARVQDGSTLHAPVREAVRAAAAEATVAVVSGATRAEIAPALTAAGLDEVIGTTVTVDDV